MAHRRRNHDIYLPLYLKTHNFHWNVTGPMFQTLHLMFETQYNELALAVALVAERIRALGFTAPGTYKKFVEAVGDQGRRRRPEGREPDSAPRGRPRDGGAHGARGVPGPDGASDQPTCDLLTQRMQVHEKTACMLRSLLE